MTRDEIAPVFIGYTRSFLIGILPLLLTAMDILVQLFTDHATAAPAATIIAWAVSLVHPVTAAEVTAVMQLLAPLWGMIIAQQRAGYARPYTLDPRAT